MRTNLLTNDNPENSVDNPKVGMQNKGNIERIIDIVEKIIPGEIFLPNMRGLNYNNLIEGFRAEGYDVSNLPHIKQKEIVYLIISYPTGFGIRRTE